MADFDETMRNWWRMCDKYSGDYATGDGCGRCPLINLYSCGSVYHMPGNTDWKKAGAAIEKWAAENPEPVYPTWGAYLHEKYPNEVMLEEVFAKSIPADIAQKLGLEPKEGV